MDTRPYIIAVAFSTISSLALAQTTTAPPAGTTPSTPGTAPPATSAVTSGAGMKRAESATVAVKFVTVKPADFMSSRLMGANVYNNQNESIGEIADLVVENGKAISGVVVSVGGFLGMGESYVVLDPSTVVLNLKDETWRAYVNTSKDNLKSAPKFTYTKRKT